MRHLMLLAALAPVLLLARGASAAAAGGEDEVSGVRTAVKQFVACLAANDAPAAAAAAHATEREAPFLKAMALNLSGEAKLAAALEQRFGPPAGDGTGDTAADDAVGSILILVEQAQVAVLGGSAEVGRVGGDTLPLRKVEGKWKVDVVELVARRGVAAANPVPLAQARAEALRAVLAQLKAGRYRSAAAARADCEEKFALAAWAVDCMPQEATADAR